MPQYFSRSFFLMVAVLYRVVEISLCSASILMIGGLIRIPVFYGYWSGSRVRFIDIFGWYLESTVIVHKKTKGNETRMKNSWEIAALKMYLQKASGGWLSIKTPSYRYRKSHHKDKTVSRPCYLCNRISDTWKCRIQLMRQGPGFTANQTNKPNEISMPIWCDILYLLATVASIFVDQFVQPSILLTSICWQPCNHHWCMKT